MDVLETERKVSLRNPEEVMRLARMGSFHPTRLSFMRILLRRVKSEGWVVTRPLWDIDNAGVGRAVYTASGPDCCYSLIVFSHDLPDHLRSDRVIAEAWDATFALFDGVPTIADLDRLQQHVPVQEAGRMSIRELTLSRANRSVRLFRHVVDALASGHQPDPEEIAKVGYLMRTTAVYGSGKFGLSDREVYCDRPELAAPFQAEMLTVWLIRMFSVEIVEHLARIQGGPKAVRLDPDIRRGLGIGNSTGLGMAPFLLTHPVLIHNWITARETALARVRVLPSFSQANWMGLRTALSAAIANAEAWRSEHPIQVEKLRRLRADLARTDAYLRTLDEQTTNPAEVIWRWALEHLTDEGQEQLLALLIEPFGELVDELAETMSADEVACFAIDVGMPVGNVTEQIARNYRWALDRDWDAPTETARLWYVSAEKLEPRLAERLDEPLEPYEQPLAPAREVVALWQDLQSASPKTRIGEFLSHHPEHRNAVRRIQITDRHQFSEVRDNTISADMLPIDLLRAKLSFFGATRFDPRSDRWVRITMFDNAPFPDEIATMDGDAWMYGTSDPVLSRSVVGGISQPEVTPGDASGTCPEGAGWSIGEIAALSVKAARGAGLSWGVAAEAGRAVRVLSENGLPGAEVLVEDLAAPEPGRTLVVGCRIAGPADVAAVGSEPGSLTPLLLLPFLRANLAGDKGWMVRAADGDELFKVCAGGVRLFMQDISGMPGLQISESTADMSTTTLATRVARVDPEALRFLNALAAKIYAPPSEISRAKGAGAGELDND